MKKIYLQPVATMVRTETVAFICGSQDITSDKGINYGGVDEEGELVPESRRMQGNCWYDEEDEETDW